MKLTDDVRAALDAMGKRYYKADESPGRLAPPFGEWVLFTDGHMQVAYLDPETALVAKEPRFQAAATGYVRQVTTAAPVATASREELIAFADVAPRRPCGAEGCTEGLIDCDECDGSGEIECTCDDCGDEHSSECGECRGDGSVPCDKEGCAKSAKARPAYVSGVLINRELLHQMVTACPFEDDERAEVVALDLKGSTYGSLGLRGKGWAALLMGLDRRFGDEGAPRWPVAETVPA